MNAQSSFLLSNAGESAGGVEGELSEVQESANMMPQSHHIVSIEGPMEMELRETHLGGAHGRSHRTTATELEHCEGFMRVG